LTFYSNAERFKRGFPLIGNAQRLAKKVKKNNEKEVARSGIFGVHLNANLRRKCFIKRDMKDEFDVLVR
jgi:hypothetical protein